MLFPLKNKVIAIYTTHWLFMWTLKSFGIHQSTGSAELYQQCFEHHMFESMIMHLPLINHQLIWRKRHLRNIQQLNHSEIY